MLTRETLVQALPALDGGEYQVNWRAVSGDGHPITGTFSFTVNAPAGAEETPAPAVSESAASPAASEPAPSASADPAEAEPAAEESGVASHLPWALAGAGVGAAAALAAWAIVVQVKKRRGTSA